VGIVAYLRARRAFDERRFDDCLTNLHDVPVMFRRVGAVKTLFKEATTEAFSAKLCTLYNTGQYEQFLAAIAPLGLDKAHATTNMLTQMRDTAITYLAARERQEKQERETRLAAVREEQRKYKETKDREETEKKTREAAEEEQKKTRDIENAARDRLYKAGFSFWDGSHRGLKELIKKSMNDPKSFEHVETRYTDNGDHFLVTTTFRGKNAFGGVVLNSVKAKTDLDGNVLVVLSESITNNTVGSGHKAEETATTKPVDTGYRRVEFQDSEWTVTDVKVASTIWRTETRGRPTDGKFVIVYYEVRNKTAKEARLLFSPILVDHKKREFAELDDQVLYGAKAITLEPLPASMTAKFSAIYELPSDSYIIKFRVRELRATGSTYDIDLKL
jgi:hypothetical protein